MEKPTYVLVLYLTFFQVPQLVGALMPICEAFGSCPRNVSWTLMSEEITSHAVFSNAFTLLLTLWRFDQPPLEHVTRDVPVGSHLTPEYLLLVRNSQLADQSKSEEFSRVLSQLPREPIFMDSFPKLKYWYRQHQACIASPLSGLVPGTPVHQIVEALVNFMFRKINSAGQSLITSSGSNSSGSGNEEISPHLKLPAWDILEAVPFVLNAALTACAHGTLSPRELATGQSFNIMCTVRLQEQILCLTGTHLKMVYTLRAIAQMKHLSQLSELQPTRHITQCLNANPPPDQKEQTIKKQAKTLTSF